MEEFPYYGLSWFFYLLAAASFLLFSAWKTRGWSIVFRLPLLTFIAAISFTPGVTLSGESWMSPAAIIMIFELDQKGLIGIWRSLLSIMAVWLLMLIASLGTRWWLIKKHPSLYKKLTVKTQQSNLKQSPVQVKITDPE